MPRSAHARAFKPLLLLSLATLLAIFPLILHGPSCGQDIAFHIQSWLDASAQLRHGHYPQWAFTPAWNAGEPRFVFYPPLSWLLGAALTTIFPIAACPTIFIAIALLASGLTFYKLARHFTSPNAALLAAALYLASPYMLFTAFERSAFAELLATAWIPLLLLALLRRRPTIRSIAIPIALLWLTNAPAAVIGSYAVALLATLRVLHTLYISLSSRPKSRGLIRDAVESGVQRPLYLFQSAASTVRLALTYLSGTVLGLALPAFYLIPAAYERKYVQVAMAILPNMRYQDNFLFIRTADAAHNTVNHTASTLALTLLLLTAATLITLYLRTRRPRPHSFAPPELLVISTEASRPHAMRSGETPVSVPGLTTTLTILLAIIAFLLTPLSAPIWQHLLNLAFLQFPWRLLTLLAPVLALSIALLIDNFIVPHRIQLSPSAHNLGAPCPASGTWVRRLPAALSLIFPLALGIAAYHLYAQACDPTDDSATIAQLFATHHGVIPTDEYTPTLADNDLLRTGNPGYWLAHSPNDPAPNTIPTPSELNPNLNTDDNSIPDSQTLSTPAPHHFTVTATKPSYLVLNLRDYPNWSWSVTDTGDSFLRTNHPPHIQRADGLLTIRVAPGRSRIDIQWCQTPDQTLGLIISPLALVFLIIISRPTSSKKTEPDARV